MIHQDGIAPRGQVILHYRIINGEGATFSAEIQRQILDVIPGREKNRV